ncbi:helix-turn-helix domain-containing protein [Actinomadura pelletieri]|nr:helix-turn-helix transcriptional regulator [Actinomadura pelletieri]
MEQRSDLGEFLRSRRARLQPRDVGLADYGGRRRVPGLRREELAQIAGISAGYYARLEQGLSQNASDAVLDAIARVLRLDHGERAHLYSLAKPAPKARRRAHAERLRPGVRSMIRTISGVPALAVGRRADVLAWNPLAHALLAGHLDLRAPERPDGRPNLARLVFLDPQTRELYADWDRKSRDAVGFLRRSAGRFPDDRELTELIGELTVKSPDFAALWSSHAVRECSHNTREYRHPLVGRLTLTDEMLHLPDDQGQRVVIYHAEEGSPSAEALRLLADMAAEDLRRETKPPASR